MIFIHEKYIIFEYNKVYSDRSELDLFKISISVECYDEKTDEITTLRNRNSFQTIKDIKSKF